MELWVVAYLQIAGRRRHARERLSCQTAMDASRGPTSANGLVEGVVQSAPRALLPAVDGHVRQVGHGDFVSGLDGPYRQQVTAVGRGRDPHCVGAARMVEHRTEPKQSETPGFPGNGTMLHDLVLTYAENHVFRSLEVNACTRPESNDSLYIVCQPNFRSAARDEPISRKPRTQWARNRSFICRLCYTRRLNGGGRRLNGGGRMLQFVCEFAALLLLDEMPREVSQRLVVPENADKQRIASHASERVPVACGKHALASSVGRVLDEERSLERQQSAKRFVQRIVSACRATVLAITAFAIQRQRKGLCGAPAYRTPLHLHTNKRTLHI